MRARIRQSVTKNAIQKQKAMAAVMMKFRGDTSHEVSETIRPNARALKRRASCSSHGKPRNRWRASANAFVSMSGGNGGGAIPPNGFSRN